ncbi:MAG: phospholipase D family protein, partial [Betaproteobacteria bacterium]
MTTTTPDGSAGLIRQPFAGSLRLRLRPWRGSIIATKATAIALLAMLCGCTPLPPLEDRSQSRALEPAETADTRLGRATAPQAQAHPGQSGVLMLAEGREAFATRMLLAEAAERSLDVQVYIWHADLTGTLLMQAMRAAADRGVRVRILLDDNNTAGMDERLAALDNHPHIEVRLFNPFMQRDWRWLGYLTDFGRLNRRMHNKSMTADNRASIVGGRNIGDAYFDAGQEVAFVDLDVLATGAVVPQVSADFDRYWASASAYPVASLLPAAAPGALNRLTASAAAMARSPEAAPYVAALERSKFIQQLVAGELALEWTAVRLVSDDPAKGLGLANSEVLVPQRLHEVLGRPQHELLLVSPYFVPTDSGTRALTELSARGVGVSVLTNSLAATDVPAVHAGYAKRRPALLRGGVKLFELKPDSNASHASIGDRGLTGSSGASLHAKTFAIDGQRVFVGSFNLDPRSAALNTESGFVIDSPPMASRIAAAFS